MRLKALTIVEIMIALLISSFIVVIVMLVYFIIHAQFSNYNSANEKVNEYFILNQLLKKDFEDAERIRVKDNQTLYFNDTTLHTYYFDTSYAIRNYYGKVDTFLADITMVKFKYKNKFVSNGISDRLDLEVLIKNSDKKFIMVNKKEYDSFSIINK